MGGAQPLAVTMCRGVCLAVEVDEHRLDRRLETRYLDKKTSDLAEAIRWVEEAKEAKNTFERRTLRNAAEVFPKLRAMGFMPDLITDQTSAHDPLYGYVPTDTTLEGYATKRESNKEALLQEVRKSMALQVDAMLAGLMMASLFLITVIIFVLRPKKVAANVPLTTLALCRPISVLCFAKGWARFVG